MKSIGLDIGTTTICGVVIDISCKKSCESLTLPNDAAIKDENSFAALQDPVKIKNICDRIIDTFKSKYDDIVSIGVTGQMHGILYADSNGNPVSPLFSWQDKRGDLIYKDGKTYAGYLSEKTGCPLATGFGITTHFYNMCNNIVPKDSAYICTIPDYIAMYLSGRKHPVMHKSMAASLGMFDVKNNSWNNNALNKAGIDIKILPHIADEKASGNKTDIIAIGDNQASFLGSVGTKGNILMNVGTGSQISIKTDANDDSTDIEFRPYIEDTYLMVGAPLCGGSSYALLKNFFSDAIELFGGNVPENIYEIMNDAALKLIDDNNIPIADTRFNGTRKEPLIRGSISNLSTDNFTPAQFTLAILKGICTELYDIYIKAPAKSRSSSVMYGSGNGIRKNPVLKKLAESTFEKELIIPAYSEEASYGAALFSLYRADYIKTLHDIKAMVDIISPS